MQRHFDVVCRLQPNCYCLYSSGPQEVKTFVDLVTNAAGESDFEHDRILDFEAVCQNFRPIIFNVPKNSNFHTFYEACQETAIHTTKPLIKKLVSNSRG